MNRFIRKVVFFIVPLIILSFLLEIVLRTLPNDYVYKRKYLDTHSDSIEVLILGSSHAYYGIDPEYMSNRTFNAGYISQTLDIDYRIFEKYKDDLTNLQTIIIPVSYFTLFNKLIFDSESWRTKNYKIYYGIDLTKNLSDCSEVLSNRFSTNIHRLYSYYILKRPGITCNNLGWGINYISSEQQDLISTGIEGAQRHSVEELYSEEEQGIFSENIHILELFVEWCESNDVNLILITLPAFESYVDNLVPEQIELSIQTATDLSEKSKRCRYINMLADTTYIDKDFYDADHFSEIGATKFSKKLNELVLSLDFNTNP